MVGVEPFVSRRRKDAMERNGEKQSWKYQNSDWEEGWEEGKVSTEIASPPPNPMPREWDPQSKIWRQRQMEVGPKGKKTPKVPPL